MIREISIFLLQTNVFLNETNVFFQSNTSFVCLLLLHIGLENLVWFRRNQVSLGLSASVSYTYRVREYGLVQEKSILLLYLPIPHLPLLWGRLVQVFPHQCHTGLENLVWFRRNQSFSCQLTPILLLLGGRLVQVFRQ